MNFRNLFYVLRILGVIAALFMSDWIVNMTGNSVLQPLSFIPMLFLAVWFAAMTADKFGTDSP